MTLKEERKWSRHCLRDKGTNSLSMLLGVSLVWIAVSRLLKGGRTVIAWGG